MNTHIIGICIGLLLFNLNLIFGNELSFIDAVLKKTKPLTISPEIKALWDKITTNFIQYEEERQKISSEFGGIFENLNHKILKDKLESYLKKFENKSESERNDCNKKNLDEALEMVNDMIDKSRKLKLMLFPILLDIYYMFEDILGTKQLDRIGVALFTLVKKKIIHSNAALDRMTTWNDFYKTNLQFVTEQMIRMGTNRYIMRSDGNMT